MTFDMAGIIPCTAAPSASSAWALRTHRCPKWDAMISTGRKFIWTSGGGDPSPVARIFIVSLGFNLLGDALRDLLDPHLRQQK